MQSPALSIFSCVIFPKLVHHSSLSLLTCILGMMTISITLLGWMKKIRHSKVFSKSLAPVDSKQIIAALLLAAGLHLSATRRGMLDSEASSTASHVRGMLPLELSMGENS